jgi:hypothetical protein
MESNGAPDRDKEGHLKYPLHGKIANIPASEVEVIVQDRPPYRITIRGGERIAPQGKLFRVQLGTSAKIAQDGAQVAEPEAS